MPDALPPLSDRCSPDRPVPDPVLCAALAADLDAGGFRADRLEAWWGAEAVAAAERGVSEPALRVMSADAGALATLARLFLLGFDQPADQVEAAVPTATVAGLVRAGLAVLRGDRVAATVLLRPCVVASPRGAEHWWIASDLDESVRRGPLRDDHVLGVSRASRTLAGLVVSGDGGRALDLGCGCGIQALVISRQVDHVVATDVSKRALAFAAFNARLNGVTNISFRAGSLFEPVRGERFDLIVSNPPFVITPRAAAVPQYEYRDGGMVGDALVERVIRDAPEHLTPGGIAQLLGNWESRSASDARAAASGLERLRGWVADEVDAWVIEREELSPLAYAELWIRDGGTTAQDPGFSALVGAWLDDFARRGVSAVGFGSVLLRRATDEGERMRRFEHHGQALPDAAQGLRDGLAGHDAVSEGTPARLLCAADVTEARHFLPGAGDPSVIELRQGGGFGRTMSVDPALAALVGACDGELTVAQIMGALAELFEVPLTELSAGLEPGVRALIRDGFLVPA